MTITLPHSKAPLLNLCSDWTESLGHIHLPGPQGLTTNKVNWSCPGLWGLVRTVRVWEDATLRCKNRDAPMVRDEVRLQANPILAEFKSNRMRVLRRKGLSWMLSQKLKTNRQKQKKPEWMQVLAWRSSVFKNIFQINTPAKIWKWN